VSINWSTSITSQEAGLGRRVVGPSADPQQHLGALPLPRASGRQLGHRRRDAVPPGGRPWLPCAGGRAPLAARRSGLRCSRRAGAAPRRAEGRRRAAGVRQQRRPGPPPGKPSTPSGARTAAAQPEHPAAGAGRCPHARHGGGWDGDKPERPRPGAGGRAGGG